jgi:hypothetical protein
LCSRYWSPSPAWLSSNIVAISKAISIVLDSKYTCSTV